MSERSCRTIAGRRHAPSRPAPGDGPPRARRLLRGRYEVGDLIGAGASADVHRGRDLRTGTAVAIKVLRPSLADDHLFRSSFRREARTAAALSHPAIVSVHDAGWDEVDAGASRTVRVPFIVMELITGRSLREVLRSRRLTLGEALQHQLGVLAALEAMHRAGVVHRDIKPANVMITTEDTVKVVDFGISRALGDPDATLTLARAFLGTPTYLSPEQARGDAVDARSDVYAAGCLFFEMLTGRPPFVGGEPLSVLYRHVHEEPARATTSSPALDAAVARSLAKAPADRFQDARSFSDALLSAAIGAVSATRRHPVRTGRTAVATH